MGNFTAKQPMAKLSPQQKAEAERLFSQGLHYANMKDYQNAVICYRRAADYGHPGAQNNLGNLYRSGTGVVSDVEEAFRLYYESAQYGNTVAMRNLAFLYERGIGTQADIDEAIAWLTTAAELKDCQACIRLAEHYDGYRYKDEEKKVYWYRRAGELGSAESYFRLGRYYATDFKNKNTTLAVESYDLAARIGDDDMKLKVALALDKPIWGNEEALDLRKAGKWYNEVTYSDKEDLQLEAAKGLAGLRGDSGRETRYAPDAEKAYMIFRTLAAKGNKRACELAAYCSEVGHGTVPNIDIAIMFYDRAGEKSKAAWCRKKKAGDLTDHPFEEHKKFHVLPEEPDVNSGGAEYYFQNIKNEKSVYDKRIYYIRNEYHEPVYLCSSNLNGEEIRIISVEDDYSYGYVHVNTTGIYLYTERDEFLYVKHIAFDGRTIRESKVRIGEEMYARCIAFYENHVYFVRSNESDSDAPVELMVMCVDTGAVKLLYQKAAQIERLFARKEALIFCARYENDECEQSWESGWMILHLNSGNVECLSNPYCSPENVVDNPAVYDEEDPRYEPNHAFDRNIVTFDFARGLFWTERREQEGPDSGHLQTVKYWEPRYLWGDRDSIVSGLPIWRVSNQLSGSTYAYFDGVHLYHAEHYSVFKANEMDGTEHLWSEGNFGHGECDQFKILGDYLFLNIAAYYEEQYPLSTQKAEPIRKSWFREKLPQDTINRFQNKETYDLKGKKSVQEKIPCAATEPAREEKIPAYSPAKQCGELKLCEFRENVDHFEGAREILLQYRKSLENKWDYNAFVGILMSVKGPRFQDPGCMNVAIGQGDNFKSTETRLGERGLLDLYNKYKGKKYDHSVTVKMVEEEILSIVPEYRSIREYFDKIVIEPMNSGVSCAAEPPGEKTKPETISMQEDYAGDMTTQKKITAADVKYNICSMGAKFHVGFGVQLTITIDGKRYPCKSHNSIKGRIDGLKRFYIENDIAVDTLFIAEYSAEQRIITLKNVRHTPGT